MAFGIPGQLTACRVLLRRIGCEFHSVCLRAPPLKTQPTWQCVKELLCTLPPIHPASHRMETAWSPLQSLNRADLTHLPRAVRGRLARYGMDL